jgi:hypothetical protein
MERKFRSLYIAALAVVSVGLLGVALVPKAHADTWDKKTIVTVHESVVAGTKGLQPAGRGQFAFWETPLGVPKAVRAWLHTASSNALVGLTGFGLLSFSGMISLFTKKSA